MMYIRNPNPDRTWEAYLENALSTEALQYVEQYVQICKHVSKCVACAKNV